MPYWPDAEWGGYKGFKGFKGKGSASNDVYGKWQDGKWQDGTGGDWGQSNDGKWQDGKWTGGWEQTGCDWEQQGIGWEQKVGELPPPPPPPVQQTSSSAAAQAESSGSKWSANYDAVPGTPPDNSSAEQQLLAKSVAHALAGVQVAVPKPQQQTPLTPPAPPVPQTSSAPQPVISQADAAARPHAACACGDSAGGGAEAPAPISIEQESAMWFVGSWRMKDDDKLTPYCMLCGTFLTDGHINSPKHQDRRTHPNDFTDITTVAEWTATAHKDLQAYLLETDTTSDAATTAKQMCLQSTGGNANLVALYVQAKGMAEAAVAKLDQYNKARAIPDVQI